MEIKFYKTKSEENRINKVITNEIVLTGELKEECDAVNPALTVSLNPILTTYNYVYIPAFNRYYFINSWKVVNKMLVFTLHCDVLMSFKNDILTSKATIIRNKQGNSYISDSLVLSTNKIKRQCQAIGTPFTKSEKFVIQLGG